jgi:hypothetical protein
MQTIKYNKTGIKVLTPRGFKNFRGIRKQIKECIELQTTTQSLSCTLDHKILNSNGLYVEANKLQVNDYIITNNGLTQIVSKIHIGINEVYDLIDVEDTSAYYTNNILSHNCQFMSSGELAINEELFESLKVNCVKPKIVMDENNYKVWREPDDNGVYVVGVDIAEGVNQNASVVQILDLKDLNNIEQVAIYWSNTINPYNFTTKLHEILLQWGSPPACIERNGCGAQVVDQLYNNLRYNNIVSFEVGLGKIKQNRVGIISHTNTKYRCVMNMRYFVNECNSVNIRDIDTLIEIKNFIKYPSGKWAAKPGMDMLDDRVMSLGWALIILDNDICKRYFDILRYDGNNRPVEIRRYDHDYGIKVNKKMFGWSAEADDDVDTIIFTENNTSTTPVIDDMKAQGWTMIGDYQTHRSYTPPPDSSYSLF